MLDYLDRVQGAFLKQIKARKLNDEDAFSLRLHRAQEELGEVSRAFRNLCNLKDEDGAWGRQRVKENLVEEAVDSVISSLALFVATSGTPEEFAKIFKRKMEKWEANIDNARD